MTASADNNQKTWPLIKRIFAGYLRPHFKSLGLAMLFMILAAAMTGGMAKLMEPIIDEVFKDQSSNRIYEVATLVLMVFTFRGIATFAHSVIMNRVGQAIVSALQNQLYRHVLMSDLATLNAQASGHIVSRVINDVSVMRSSMAECFTGIFKSTLTLFFLVMVMFWQDWRLAIAAFIAFPLAAFFVGRVGKKLRRISAHTQEEMGAFSSFLTQTFQGIRQVKAYGMEMAEFEKAESVIDRIMRLANKAYRTSALTTPVTEFLSGIAIATVLVYGGLQVLSGAQTAGALFSFITAFMLAYEPMKKLGKLNGQLQMGLAAAVRVFATLDQQPKIVNPTPGQALSRQDARVEFAAVNFAYGTDMPALKQVSFKIEAGQTAAFVGPSGAGKSTLLNLLLRFYEADKGQIFIGQHNIADIALADLRKQIALVSQEAFLFDNTVFANIAYGRLGATREEVLKAARDANAESFILQLPDGFETRVGEQGVKLSGGQRQRIAIARAMLRDAPILLLDEATSALDTESERLVQDALRRLSIGRTTLVVAHRLSTIQDADMIFVLDQGEIVEQGNHQQLMRLNGLYAKLYGMSPSASEDGGLNERTISLRG